MSTSTGRVALGLGRQRLFGDDEAVDLRDVENVFAEHRMLLDFRPRRPQCYIKPIEEPDVAQMVS